VAEQATLLTLDRGASHAIFHGPGKVIYLDPGGRPVHFNERSFRLIVKGWLLYEIDRRGPDALTALLSEVAPDPSD
jgi:hypothetical protein